MPEQAVVQEINEPAATETADELIKAIVQHQAQDRQSPEGMAGQSVQGGHPAAVLLPAGPHALSQESRHIGLPVASDSLGQRPTVAIRVGGYDTAGGRQIWFINPGRNTACEKQQSRQTRRQGAA